jgi:hypothetical protein
VPGLQLRRRVPPRSAGPAPFAHLEGLVSWESDPDGPPPLDWAAVAFVAVLIALAIFGILYVRV